LLNAGPASIRAAHDFMARRRDASQAMNRLYVAEVMPTPTGAVADHRLAARPTELGLIAQALAAAVGVALPWPAPELPERLRRWVAAAAADLREHAGA